jgi:NADPH:quinone reductase-like Zn-dependent oxidoreductase
MRAVRFHRRGGPEVLQLDEVPRPEPGPGEVRVAVRAVALNHLDLWVRRGLPIRMEMPHVGGTDFAGVVDALGADVQGLAVGDAVVGYPLLRAPARAAGAPRVILGEERNGALCEALVLPPENLVPKPEALDFEQAAAMPVAFVTAWTMLVERAALRAGETLLVRGAASGVGTAAVQIGRWLGARVIACARPAWHRALAELGAEVLLDDHEPRLAERVRAETRREGAHVVFEHVGGDGFAESVAAAAIGGRIVTCGATAGRTAALDLRILFGRELQIHGVTLGSRETLVRVLALAGEGVLRPVIDQVLPLSRCREAQERLETGGVFGKIVLRVDAGPTR